MQRSLDGYRPAALGFVDMVLPRIALSPERSLVYVLRESGCHGQLTVGEVERTGISTINVYDQRGKLFEYLSGTLRSWCIANAWGIPVQGWNAIMPSDVARVLSYRRPTQP